MRKSFFAILLAVLVSAPVYGQVTGETEAGSDERRGRFFSQYVFYDVGRINVLTRYFWVNDVVHRGEFAIGPTLKFGPVIVKGQFGGTTDRQLMVGTLIIARVADRDVIYIFDSKSSAWLENPHEIYQKLWVPLNKSGGLQFRYEDLEIGREHIFARIGFEGRYNLSVSGIRHLYFAPFYDPIHKSIGSQTGLRF